MCNELTAVMFCRRLANRLDTIKRTACGDGYSQCLLCGQQFGLMGVSTVMCDECKKVLSGALGYLQNIYRTSKIDVACI